MERWYWIDPENSLDWKSWRWSRSYQWGPLVWSLKAGNDGWLTDRCGQEESDPGITTWLGQENKSGCKVGLQLHRKVWEKADLSTQKTLKKQNSISSPWLPHWGGWKSGRNGGLSWSIYMRLKGNRCGGWKAENLNLHPRLETGPANPAWNSNNKPVQDYDTQWTTRTSHICSLEIFKTCSWRGTKGTPAAAVPRYILCYKDADNVQWFSRQNANQSLLSTDISALMCLHHEF